jgi:dGTPase
VVEREAAGYEIVEKLMSTFTHAVHFTIYDQEKKSARHKTIYRMIPRHLQFQIEKRGVSIYESLQIVIDFISGLTDSSATRLYQTILGFAKN